MKERTNTGGGERGGRGKERGKGREREGEGRGRQEEGGREREREREREMMMMMMMVTMKVEWSTSEVRIPSCVVGTSSFSVILCDYLSFQTIFTMRLLPASPTDSSVVGTEKKQQWLNNKSDSICNIILRNHDRKITDCMKNDLFRFL